MLNVDAVYIRRIPEEVGWTWEVTANISGAFDDDGPRVELEIPSGSSDGFVVQAADAVAKLVRDKAEAMAAEGLA